MKQLLALVFAVFAFNSTVQAKINFDKEKYDHCEIRAIQVLDKYYSGPNEPTIDVLDIDSFSAHGLAKGERVYKIKLHMTDDGDMPVDQIYEEYVVVMCRSCY